MSFIRALGPGVGGGGGEGESGEDAIEEEGVEGEEGIVVVWELVTRRSIRQTEEIGAAVTTEARNRVNGSGGDDYQGGSECGSGNKSEYLASVEVA